MLNRHYNKKIFVVNRDFKNELTHIKCYPRILKLASLTHNACYPTRGGDNYEPKIQRRIYSHHGQALQESQKAQPKESYPQRVL